MCDVLVVDDEDTVRMVLVDMLEDEGLSVRDATTVDEAIKAAQEPPGCAVLVTDVDLGAPGVDGFSLAESVRKYVPEVPVLFVSGRPWTLNGRATASNERALAKPFGKAELIAAVQALLELRRQRHPDCPRETT
ncbi:response regulator transcription factor [Roseomonas harenae]|jgi:DNA-binding response OmpR family regulator|uniref:response regulator transcription factor n=1 Tax=Muricoccus harenae TaxID=2692566 RepID=UPI0013312C53|nr:response regulator [Roseomonas harenae]